MKAPSNRTVVPYNQRIDIPSRLFYKITAAMGINLKSWKTYLEEYIRALHPDRDNDMIAVKKERSTTVGNTNNALWYSNSLSFSKLLSGLHVLKIKEVKITLWVKTEDGKEYTVEEHNRYTDY